MQTIPTHDYNGDVEVFDSVDRVVVEHDSEIKMKSLLDNSSKWLVLSTTYRGHVKNYVFEVLRSYRMTDEPTCLSIRFAAELPKIAARMNFHHIGVVANIGGVQKLIWRERCSLANTNVDVVIDVMLFMKMERGV